MHSFHRVLLQFVAITLSFALIYHASNNDNDIDHRHPLSGHPADGPQAAKYMMQPNEWYRAPSRPTQSTVHQASIDNQGSYPVDNEGDWGAWYTTPSADTRTSPTLAHPITSMSPSHAIATSSQLQPQNEMSLPPQSAPLTSTAAEAAPITAAIMSPPALPSNRHSSEVIQSPVTNPSPKTSNPSPQQSPIAAPRRSMNLATTEQQRAISDSELATDESPQAKSLESTTEMTELSLSSPSAVTHADAAASAISAQPMAQSALPKPILSPRPPSRSSSSNHQQHPIARRTSSHSSNSPRQRKSSVSSLSLSKTIDHNKHIDSNDLPQTAIDLSSLTAIKSPTKKEMQIEIEQFIENYFRQRSNPLTPRQQKQMKKEIKTLVKTTINTHENQEIQRQIPNPNNNCIQSARKKMKKIGKFIWKHLPKTSPRYDQIMNQITEENIQSIIEKVNAK